MLYTRKMIDERPTGAGSPFIYTEEQLPRLSLHIFFTLGTDIWVQKGREKVGLSGNILVKSNIPKSKFDVFDIREDLV